MKYEYLLERRKSRRTRERRIMRCELGVYAGLGGEGGGDGGRGGGRGGEEED